MGSQIYGNPCPMESAGKLVVASKYLQPNLVL